MAVVVTVAALGLAVLSGPADGWSPAADAAPTWDAYGGWSGLTVGATGRFRAASVGGRWWLVTPEGHPFFSNGLNHVTPLGTVDRHGHAAYHDTIMAKYGSEQAWADAQVPRMAGWGINTLGGWSDVGRFEGRMPYTMTLSLAGQDTATGRMADFWAESWVDTVHQATEAAASGRTTDPWLVGYFLDNELHWTKDWRPVDQLDHYFERGPAEPGKVHLVTWLRDRYGADFARFRTDFATEATDWDSLPSASTATDVGSGAQTTRDAWSGELAQRYFAVTDAALAAADPTHLNLGSRFLGQLILPEVLDAAARFVDVVSINWYEVKPEIEEYVAGLGPRFLPTADTLAAHRSRADRPLLISEFGWRAMDSGLPNTWPPLQVVLETQRDRADRYRNFGRCLINTGEVVGAHWFEMTDEPAIGRFDGEDDNWGLVNERDEEYPLVTAAALDVHDEAYAPLTDPQWSPGACAPIGPQPSAPVVPVAVPIPTAPTAVALEPAPGGSTRPVTAAFTG